MLIPLTMTIMQPKVPNNPSTALNSALQELKKPLSERVGERKAPEPEELPPCNGMKIEEHALQMNLPNDVDDNDPLAIFMLFIPDFILQLTLEY